VVAVVMASTAPAAVAVVVRVEAAALVEV